MGDRMLRNERVRGSALFHTLSQPVVACPVSVRVISSQLAVAFDFESYVFLTWALVNREGNSL